MSAVKNLIPASSSVVTTRVATTFLRPDGIMQVDALPDSVMTLADAIEAIKAQAQVGGGIRRPLLVNVGSIKSMDRDARIYLGAKEAQSVVTATAIIVKTVAAKIIATFFMGLNKTLYPTRMFTSEDEAVNWLREFLK